MSSFIYSAISIGYDIFDLDDCEVPPSVHEGNNYCPPKAKLMGKEMPIEGGGDY